MGPSLRSVTKITALIAVCGVALSALDRGSSPSASAPAFVAATPEELSAQIVANDSALREGIDTWRGPEDPPSGAPPDQVLVEAEFLQDSVRFLTAHPSTAKETIALLPAELAREISDLTAAARKLRKLSGGSHRKLKTGEPPSLAELVGHYQAAQQRYGIATRILAAIHHVETKFGRVKSNSVAGAKGPMQFIPSTWRIYGRGGNIHDPHDAILAAARLLRANGAPRSYSRALFHYNPSRLYVGAVKLYAKVIARDPYALYFLYGWGP
jgi:membrane-bound lytic murein transglycosylase B